MKYFAIVAVVAGLSFFAPSPAKAQVSVGINIGAAPVCPYGYFDYSPYNCAPYGYYGPEWYSGGFFIGVGPWFRGPRDFDGYIDRRFDPRYGYHGSFPHRGDRDDHFRGYRNGEFHGNERVNGYEHHDNSKHGDHRDHGDHGNHGNHGDHGDHGDHGGH